MVESGTVGATKKKKKKNSWSQDWLQKSWVWFQVFFAARKDDAFLNLKHNLHTILDQVLENSKGGLKGLLDMLLGTDPDTNPFAGKEQKALENLKAGLKFLLDSFLDKNKGNLQFLQDALLGQKTRSA
jgi:hypothetical protein